MRIGIGALINPTGGPARFAGELVRALGQLDGDDEYVVFTNRPNLFEVAPRVAIVDVPLAAAPLEPLWDHVLLPAAIRRRPVDLYHGVKGALPLRLACPRVVSIHDLAIYAYPETFAWQQHLHMRPHLRLAARAARRVIADSDHARRDIEQRLRLRPGTVVAVPLGVRHDVFHPEADASDDEVARRLDLPARFFLYSGTIQPRKNIDVLVQAHAGLAGRVDWPLVLAGRRRPDYSPAWLNRPPAGVRFLGAVSDADLAVLYRRASALISPSSWEGFGLTLLEAMASGCPVVAVGVSSVPEVVGDAGVLLPRPDTAEVATAMERLAADQGWRRELAERGRARAATFGWDGTARRVREVYREVLAHG